MKKALALVLAAILLLSAAGCGSSEPETSPFVDMWYSSGNRSWERLAVREDGSWALYYPAYGTKESTDIIDSGIVRQEKDGTLTLMRDGAEQAKLELRNGGILQIAPVSREWYFDTTMDFRRKSDSKQATVPTEAPTEAPTEIVYDCTSYLGLWKYDDRDEWLEIGTYGDWAIYDASAQLQASGEGEPGDGFLLMTMEEGVTMTVEFDGVDTLIDSNGDQLHVSMGIEPSNLFSLRGLEQSLFAGGGPVTLSDGGYSFRSGGSNFAKCDLTWEAEYLEDKVLDTGMRVAKVMFVGTFPKGVCGRLDETCGFPSAILDSYSGVALPTQAITGDKDANASQFRYDLEVNGQEYPVYLRHGLTWEKKNDTWIAYVTVEAEFPQEYDGLTWCAYTSFESYQEMRDSHDSVFRADPQPLSEADWEKLHRSLLFYFG